MALGLPDAEKKIAEARAELHKIYGDEVGFLSETFILAWINDSADLEDGRGFHAVTGYYGGLDLYGKRHEEFARSQGPDLGFLGPKDRNFQNVFSSRKHRKIKEIPDDYILAAYWTALHPNDK